MARSACELSSNMFPPNLKDFFGSSVYEDIERGFDENERCYLGLCTEFDIFPAEDRNVKRAEDKEAKADSSVVSVQQGEFDWMEFLKTYCALTESEARNWVSKIQQLKLKLLLV
ncbi:hypothetical protein GAYE_SCF37G5121 [Galdieria yellowstonensis]|uniref:Uncharacterized protein n=1 Tax=Galdieria yellowstonensis TaxID=3028027 RepID=A0AAV9IIG8_9RHOD|nr:hypothetical protein GAYE_SCF37G5121 [Galdieria yellowstonensis]